MHADYVAIPVEARIQAFIEHEESHHYLDGAAYRIAFFKRLMECIHEDVDFKAMVQQQLDLYCGRPYPKAVYKTMNEPHHMIRNMMMRWDIDHVKEEPEK